MARLKITIPKKDLYRLYHKENKSTFGIAKIYNCSPTTISNRLNKFNIPRKSKCQIHMRYPKYDFSGNLTEKAYLIGFRLGDLRVFKTRSDGETIIAQCHTTQDVQVELLNNLFNKYGKVSVTNLRDDTIDINCYLNESFSFLLPKKDDIESWICKDKKFSSAFIAGYTDAEGNFIINQGKGRFKIDSYDKKVLKKIHLWLTKKKINNKLRLIGKKGERRPEGYHFNNNLWRMNINEARSLSKFISTIKPFIRHKKRIKDINIVLNNIRRRKQRGTI